MDINKEKLITENLNLVEYIVRHEITKSKSVIELEYDDLYQTGCLALCKAANCYDGRVKFVTYAARVVRNALIDYCRKIKSGSLSLEATFDTDEELCLKNILDAGIDIEQEVQDNSICSALNDSKKAYSGVVLKGIEALELKLKGYSGSEIAALYGVKNNHVSAWIAKAVKRLKDNPEFMASFF